MATSKNARKLKSIRVRAMGLRELARAIGWGASRYQYYEDAYTKKYIPQDVIDLVRPHLVGRGEPPVTDAEIDALLSPRRASPAPTDVAALLRLARHAIADPSSFACATGGDGKEDLLELIDAALARKSTE